MRPFSGADGRMLVETSDERDGAGAEAVGTKGLGKNKDMRQKGGNNAWPSAKLKCLVTERRRYQQDVRIRCPKKASHRKAMAEENKEDCGDLTGEMEDARLNRNTNKNRNRKLARNHAGRPCQVASGWKRWHTWDHHNQATHCNGIEGGTALTTLHRRALTVRSTYSVGILLATLYATLLGGPGSQGAPGGHVVRKSF